MKTANYVRGWMTSCYIRCDVIKWPITFDVHKWQSFKFLIFLRTEILFAMNHLYSFSKECRFVFVPNSMIFEVMLRYWSVRDLDLEFRNWSYFEIRTYVLRSFVVVGKSTFHWTLALYISDETKRSFAFLSFDTFLVCDLLTKIKQ